MAAPTAINASVTVRPVTPALSARLCALRVETGQYGYVGDIQSALLAAAANPHCTAMAVLLDEQVVGYYCLDLGNGRRSGDSAMLSGLRIDRAMQGRGIGRRALAACVADLRQRFPQVRTLLAHLDSGNQRAIDLYRRAGFVEGGIWNFGSTLPQQLMKLTLDASSPGSAPGMGKSAA